SPCTISRRSIASSGEQAAHPFRSWSASCRSTARDTPSSFTTRCRVSRFQRGFAGGFARPAMAPSASGSRWRKSWCAPYALVTPAPTSCPRSAASRWSRRWSRRSAEPTSLGVREAAEAIRKGVLSPVELVEACLARIGALDGDLRAWAHVDAAGALAIAGERESEARAGRLRGPLHGVPVGVKDIFDVAGMPTTGGATVSKIELPPSFQELAAAGLTVLEAEAAAYHERWFAKHADDYGPEIRSLVEAGLRLSATAYVSANRARLAFRGDVMSLLAAHDAL